MQYVRYEVAEPHIALITLDRPDRLNALGAQLSAELEEALGRYEDDPGLRAAVLTGAGRAFCAGADVKEWAATGAAPFRGAPRHLLFHDWGTPNLSKPLIGAVRGYCLGAGLNLVLMRCDLRVAGESARFGLPEVARGVMDLCTPFGYQAVPTCFVAELALTGDAVDARRAHHFGLVNQVVPDDQVVEAALALARRIVRHSPAAVRATKRNLLQVMAPPEGRFAVENLLRQRSFSGPDALEGMRAYVEQREPRWQG